MWQLERTQWILTVLFLCYHAGSRHYATHSVHSVSCVWVFVNPWTAACQASLSITNSWSLLESCPLSWWCHPTISSSVISFSSWLQSFPMSGSFPMSQHIRWPKYWSFGFSISPSSEYSVLISLGLTGLISLQSKGISRVLSNTTVQKHQLFGAQPSLWSNSHFHTWLLKNHSFD